MEKLEEILCEVFKLKKEELNDSLTMADVDHWDSLTHMDLVTSLEDGLNIELTMDDIMNMKDVATIKSIILEKQ
ncbi:MAG: acyl carrier protein [Arcobacteraceae bacterium]|nr:acyl carrier protein [Arcobacteraceae bacterium]